MSLGTCKECGGQISRSAKSCPHCGHAPKETSKALLFLVVFVIVGLFGSMLGTGNGSQNNSNNSSVKRKGANKDSCAKISQLFGYDSKLTSVQKDELWKAKYENSIFKWKFQVVSVDTAYDGGYDVVLVCLPPASRPVLVRMSFPENQKSAVMKLAKGTPYTLSGVAKEFEVPPRELADQVSLRIQSDSVE